MPVQNFENLLSDELLNSIDANRQVEQLIDDVTFESNNLTTRRLDQEILRNHREILDALNTRTEIMHEDEKSNLYNLDIIPDYLLNDPQIVGYPDEDTQIEIYEWVKSYLPNVNYSIKDFGAGRGDFYDFINCDKFDGEKNKLIDYFGIDLNPNIVNVAKSKYPGIQIFNNDYLDISIESDYTVVIGTLNENSGLDKWENFNKTLIHAQNTTKKAILFVLQANCYGFEGSNDFPIHEVVQRLPENTKFTIDNSKLEDIYVLVVHIGDYN